MMSSGLCRRANVSKTSSLDVGFSTIPVGYLPFDESTESEIKKRCKRRMQFSPAIDGMTMGFPKGSLFLATATVEEEKLQQ